MKKLAACFFFSLMVLALGTMGSVQAYPIGLPAGVTYDGIYVGGTPDLADFGFDPGPPGIEKDTYINVNQVITLYNTSGNDPAYLPPITEPLVPPSAYIYLAGEDGTSGTIDLGLGYDYISLKYDSVFSLFYVADLDEFGFSGLSHDLSHARGWNPVPEPATMLLLGSGLLGLVGIRRKFRK